MEGQTYDFVQVRSVDGIHTEASCTTGALNALVQPSESSKGEGIVGNGTHDPVRQRLIHGISEVIEEV